MTHTSTPPIGAVVTYCKPSTWRPFRQAVVIGPGVCDPETGGHWIAIESADGAVELISPEAVVEIDDPDAESMAAEHLDRPNAD